MVIWVAPSEKESSGIYMRTANGPPGYSLSANRIIGYYIECFIGEQMLGCDFVHVQDDVDPHILRMLKGTFSLGTTYFINLFLLRYRAG